MDKVNVSFKKGYTSQNFPPAAGLAHRQKCLIGRREKYVLRIVLRMKTIGKTKHCVLPAADVKNNETAPHNAGSRDFVRLAGLLPIGAGSAKRKKSREPALCGAVSLFFTSAAGKTYFLVIPIVFIRKTDFSRLPNKHFCRWSRPAAGGKF